MYSLQEAWKKMFGQPPFDQWNGKLYCSLTDAALTFRTNRTQGYMAAYTFTLVTEGRVKIVYNGQVLTLQADDLYVYSPGLEVTVEEVSDDYRAICLLADEHITIESPIAHDLVHLAYAPIVQLHQPKLTLSHEDARRLADLLRDIIGYLHSDHIYKEKILQMLYAVFLLELQNVQEKVMTRREVPQRIEDLFIGFIRLLPLHFIEHHDIGFYANALNISTVYLSRVVRRVAGRTVIDYINQMLLMEASFLLNTTSLSIAQIADRLHFADAPSFSKFFSRMKGQTPGEYRNEK